MSELQKSGVKLVAEGGDAFENALNRASDSAGAFEGAITKAAGATSAASEIAIGALRHLGTLGVDALLGVIDKAAQLGQTAVKSALENEEAFSKLRTILKSAGQATGITEKQVEALGKKLSYLAGGSDDAIIAITEMGLRMGTVNKGNLEQFTIGVLDLAKVMGSTENATLLLSLAMEDPISAMGKARKAGILFSDTMETQIKKMVEAKDVAGASRVVMNRLAEATKGSAAAAAATLGGRLTIIQGRLGEALESIGGKFLNVLDGLLLKAEPLIPILEDGAEVLGDLITHALVGSGALTYLGKGIAGVVSFAEKFLAVMKLVDSNGIGALIPPSLVSSLAPITSAFEKLYSAVLTNLPAMKAAGQDFYNWINEQLAILAPKLISSLGASIETIARIWEKHGATIIMVTEWIGKVIGATLGGTVTLALGILEASLNSLEGAMDTLSLLAQGRFVEAFNTLINSQIKTQSIVGDTLKAFFNLAASIAGTDWDSFIAQWSYNITTFNQIFYQIGVIIGAALKDAGKVWADNFALLGQIISLSFTNWRNSLNEWAYNALMPIASNIVGAINSAKGMLSDFQNVGWQIGYWLYEGVRVWSDWVKNWINAQVTNAYNSALGGLSYFYNVGWQLMNNAYAGLSAWAGYIVNWITYQINAAYNYAFSLAYGFYNAGWQILNQFYNGLNAWAGYISNWLYTQVSNGWAAINNAPSWFYNIGYNIIGGIVNGLWGNANAVLNALWWIVDSAINAIKARLGIASPAKYLDQELGKPMGAGVAKGILSQQGNITEALKIAVLGSVASVTPAASASQAYYSQTINHSATNNFNLTLNSNQQSEGVINDFAIMGVLATA